MKKLVQTISIVLGLVVLGCSTSLNGDSLVQIRVSADPNSTNIGNALVSNDVEFTSATVVVADIKFRPATDCSGDAEVKLAGPYVVNLLTQASLPALPEVVVEKGNYCRFEFKVDKLSDNELPEGVNANDEIVDQSIVIKGNYNTSTPFVVTLDRNEDFELISNSEGGFAFKADTSSTAFLVFSLNKLFENVDLSTLTLSSGTILIDKDHNDAAFDIIKDNLHEFAQLQKDSNGDDRLDADDDVIAHGTN